MTGIFDLIVPWLTGGGLTSTITGSISAFVKYKELKLSYDHERDRWNYEISMYKNQRDHERYLVDQKALMVNEVTATHAQRTAIESDMREVVALLKRPGDAPAWAVFRTLFRPGLTLCLFFACVFIPFMPLPTVPSGMEESTVVKGVYNTILQGFSAALGFWFGSRLVSEPINKKGGFIQ